MLLDILASNFSATSIITIVFAYAVILLFAFPLHECAHALMARILGDDTAFRQGRVTLNPLPHIDPMGALGLLIVGLGWAKPVPVNAARARKVSARAAMALTAFAGPLSNIIVSYIFIVLAKLVIVLFGAQDIVVSVAFYSALRMAASINIYLGVFNLIPLPPFDGSKIIFAFLKEKYYRFMLRYERYIMYGILIICFSGMLPYPLNLPSYLFSVPINFLTGIITSALDFLSSFIM